MSNKMESEIRLGELELNKIYNMDCLEGLKKLPDNSVDLVVTDPPYNIGKDFDNDNLKEDDFIGFLTPVLEELKRIIKPKHSIIICFDAGKKLPLLFHSITNSRLFFQKMGLYYKPNDMSMPHNRILRKSEVFCILTKTESLNHSGDTYIHDVIIANHTKKDKSFYHPTVKSTSFIRELIESHSKEKYIVLDCFMGSGTTAVACKELDRSFIGFEISKEYCEIAEERLKKVNNKKLKEWF